MAGVPDTLRTSLMVPVHVVRWRRERMLSTMVIHSSGSREGSGSRRTTINCRSRLFPWLNLGGSGGGGGGAAVPVVAVAVDYGQRFALGGRRV